MDFVEVPDGLSDDEERYRAFVEEQALAFQSSRSKKKKKRQQPRPEVEADDAPSDEAGDLLSTGEETVTRQQQQAKAVKKDPSTKHERNAKPQQQRQSHAEEARNAKQRRADEDPSTKHEQRNAKKRNAKPQQQRQPHAEEARNAKQRRAEEDPPMQAPRASDPLKQQLLGARFRLLNEQLYSMPSDAAVAMFAENPELFEVYHLGFADQAAKWPENPLDRIARWLLSKPAKWTVADFGCGEANLALQVRQTVHSFDLVALNDRVTACDMSHVPLADGSVDVAVFCLSLMGTNWPDFVGEARRVLKVGGTLLIAEVASRLPDWNLFVRAVQQLGFSGGFEEKPTANGYFVRMHFAKTAKPPSSKPVNVKLGVCKYKKR